MRELAGLTAVRALAAVALMLALTSPTAATTKAGCASKGGPGFRLPTGDCASWKQSERFCDSGCYPAGTVDERDQPAPKPPIHKVAKP